MSRETLEIILAPGPRAHAADALWPVPPYPSNSDGTLASEAMLAKRQDAYHLLHGDALKARREFRGPKFTEYLSYTVSDGGLAVDVKGATYIYPMHTIHRIKVYRA